jgi:hypothetical protein
MPDGVAGPGLKLAITANGPITLRLAEGLESLAYGSASPLPVLEVCMGETTTRITTKVEPN